MQACEAGEMHRGFLAGRLEGKRPLGRPKRKWGGNPKMDFQ
jgi:hypothetical protein